MVSHTMVVSCINEMFPVANSFSFWNGFTLNQIPRNKNGGKWEVFSGQQSLRTSLLFSQEAPCDERLAHRLLPGAYRKYWVSGESD